MEESRKIHIPTSYTNSKNVVLFLDVIQVVTCFLSPTLKALPSSQGVELLEDDLFRSQIPATHASAALRPEHRPLVARDGLVD